jgi:ribonuclease Z
MMPTRYECGEKNLAYEQMPSQNSICVHNYQVIDRQSTFMAEVLFLGTGNAFSPPGRLHALVLIDGNILIDAPPTVLPQLRNFNIHPSSIKHLLFTHWHADHIFGFPFLMLEREWMPYDLGDKEPLNIYSRPNGKKILSDICKIGFPGSLDKTLVTGSRWSNSESRNLYNTDWKFHRFPVCHTPETEPHGYELIHSSGFTILHCGDSGPFHTIEERAPNADVIILEMGIPDFVKSPYHHTPSDIISFSNRHPHVKVLVTHNFAKAPNQEHGFDVPELPEHIHQLDDGDILNILEDKSFLVQKRC